MTSKSVPPDVFSSTLNERSKKKIPIQFPWSPDANIPSYQHTLPNCSNLDIIGQPEICETCAQANKWKWQSPTPKTPECEPVSLFRPSMDNIHNTWLRYYGKVVPYRLLEACIFLFLFSALPVRNDCFYLGCKINQRLLILIYSSNLSQQQTIPTGADVRTVCLAPVTHTVVISRLPFFFCLPSHSHTWIHLYSFFFFSFFPFCCCCCYCCCCCCCMCHPRPRGRLLVRLQSLFFCIIEIISHTINELISIPGFVVVLSLIENFSATLSIDAGCGRIWMPQMKEGLGAKMRSRWVDRTVVSGLRFVRVTGLVCEIPLSMVRRSCANKRSGSN